MGANIVFNDISDIKSPTYVLSTRGGKKHGVIHIQKHSFQDNLMKPAEVSFDVYKAENTDEIWENCVDLKLLWCKELDLWYEITVELEDKNDSVKHVLGQTICESELSQINLYNIEINTETDISRDDYELPTIFYRPDHKEASLLHRLTEKIPHYQIVHVDSTLVNIQRTFTFDGKSIYDAFNEISEEIGCIFIYNSYSSFHGVSAEDEYDSYPARTISVYDLKTNCLNCGNRGTFTDVCPECESTNLQYGFGDYTNIFISSENLTDNIRYKVNIGAVKNCFKLVAGDDIMTATIRNCNPNGTDYLWHISEYTKTDMSNELVSKLNDYDASYKYYQKNYSINLNSTKVAEYNQLIDKYKTYNNTLKRITNPIVGYPALMNVYYDAIDFNQYLQTTMMPPIDIHPTDATQEAAKIDALSLLYVAVINADNVSKATADNAVLIAAKTCINANYQIKIKNSSLSGQMWTGSVTVTNYIDENDTADSVTFSIPITDDQSSYIAQQIRRTIKNDSTESLDLVNIFSLELNQFIQEIKKYSLDNLNILNQACNAALNILLEQGISEAGHEYYPLIYLPYYQKSVALQEEMLLREAEISKINGRYDLYGYLVSPGIINIIASERDRIQDSLNFEKYLGEDCWLEFCAYKREDKYTNNNYISDGLSNTELFAKAEEFIEVAKDEIIKSSELQHSIACTLFNLLAINEFDGQVQNFGVGNWLHLMADNKIYRLRLIHIQIDDDNLDNIYVEFSDVTHTRYGDYDGESIFKQASAMATSYGAVIHQAEQGQKSDRRLCDWVAKGLSLTNMKIVSGAENQEISWDDNGFSLKEYIPITDSYSDEQVKIINKGLYFTNDNWETARAGIGKFIYYDPSDRETKEGYGVIADTVVSNIVLSEKVGIYTAKNSVTIGEHGIAVSNLENHIAKALKSENNTNRMLVLASEAEYFSVGDIVSIGTTIIDESIAQNRIITSITRLQTPTTGDADESYIAFDGNPVRITTGNIMSGGIVSVNINPADNDSVFAIRTNRHGNVIWMDRNGNAHFAGTLEGANGVFSGSIKVGGTASDPNFYVDTVGNVTANNGTFGGIIKAKDIQIPNGSNGWKSILTAKNQTTGEATQNSKVGPDYLELKGISVVNGSGNTTFQVNSNGDVSMSGSLFADGTITGSTIDGGIFHATGDGGSGGTAGTVSAYYVGYMRDPDTANARYIPLGYLSYNNYGTGDDAKYRIMLTANGYFGSPRSGVPLKLEALGNISIQAGYANGRYAREYGISDTGVIYLASPTAYTSDSFGSTNPQNLSPGVGGQIYYYIAESSAHGWVQAVPYIYIP